MLLDSNFFAFINIVIYSYYDMAVSFPEISLDIIIRPFYVSLKSP